MKQVHMILNEEQRIVFHTLEEEILKTSRSFVQEFKIPLMQAVLSKNKYSQFLHELHDLPNPFHHTLTNLRTVGMAMRFIEQHEIPYYIFIFNDSIMSDIFYGVPVEAIMSHLSLGLRHEVGHCLAYRQYPGYKELVDIREPRGDRHETLEEYYARPVEAIANQLVGIDPVSLIDSLQELHQLRKDCQSLFHDDMDKAGINTFQLHPGSPYGII